MIPAQTLNITGSNFTFNQNGGTLAINGAFQMTSDTFNVNGGIITGTPLLRASTLNLAAAPRELTTAAR